MSPSTATTCSQTRAPTQTSGPVSRTRPTATTSTTCTPTSWCSTTSAGGRARSCTRLRALTPHTQRATPGPCRQATGPQTRSYTQCGRTLCLYTRVHTRAPQHRHVSLSISGMTRTWDVPTHEHVLSTMPTVFTHALMHGTSYCASYVTGTVPGTGHIVGTTQTKSMPTWRCRPVVLPARIPTNTHTRGAYGGSRVPRGQPTLSCSFPPLQVQPPSCPLLGHGAPLAQPKPV